MLAARPPSATQANRRLLQGRITGLGNDVLASASGAATSAQIQQVGVLPCSTLCPQDAGGHVMPSQLLCKGEHICTSC